MKVLIEKERGNNVKLLRSDRGGEFTTKEINEYCEIHVIYLPSTVWYSPQQNIVVKKKIYRSILDYVEE